MRPRRWIATLLTTILALTACTTATSGPVAVSPVAPDKDRTNYILCVDTDTSPERQDRCQRDVWGETFREDDPRWDCLHMGNRTCGPVASATTPTVTTTTR